MQFSIFGVPFKCTQDMFTWEKAKWSFFAYWAIGWRGLVFTLATLSMAAVILFLPAILGAVQDIPLGEDADLGLRALIKFALSVKFWEEHYLIPGIILTTAFVVSIILGAFYFHYYGVFKKNYKSFNRNYAISEIPTFKSWSFWKPYIFIIIIGLSLGIIFRFALGFLEPGTTLIQTVNAIVGFVLFHITLHGGSWGFVPISRAK